MVFCFEVDCYNVWFSILPNIAVRQAKAFSSCGMTALPQMGASPNPERISPPPVSSVAVSGEMF